MPMKKTELEKRAGLLVAHRMKHAAAGARRVDAGESADMDRRARREADRAAGRVPFAVKLPQSLVTRLHATAAASGLSLDALVTTLLDEALAATPR